MLWYVVLCENTPPYIEKSPSFMQKYPPDIEKFPRDVRNLSSNIYSPFFREYFQKGENVGLKALI